MTHDDFWRALRSAQMTRPIRQAGMVVWTPEEVLACLRSWVAQEGRLPASADLGPFWQLPGRTTIVRVYGSLQAAWAVLGWEYRPYDGRPVGRQSYTPNRACLKCDRPFHTTGRFTRICEQCKSNDEWQETGSWLCGGAVTERGEDVVGWWDGE